MDKNLLKNALVKGRRGRKVTIEIEVPEGETFLETEEGIL